MEKILEWKLRLIAVVYKLFPRIHAKKRTSVQSSLPLKWTVEQECSLQARTHRYWEFLNSEWNKNE